jgi:hypothetical protein
LQGAVAEILPLDEGGLETWATVVPASGPPPEVERLADAAWQAASEPCGTGSEIRAMRGRRVSRW